MSNTNQTWGNKVVEAVDESLLHQKDLISYDGLGFIKLTGYDHLLELIEQAEQELETYTFTSEDDRVRAKKSRAATNKALTDFKKEYKKALNAATHLYLEQCSHITDRLENMSDLLKTKLEKFDNDYRDAKRERLAGEHETLIAGRPELAGVSFDDVFDTRWLNRTTSFKNGFDQMLSRMEAVVNLRAYVSDIEESVDNQIDNAEAVKVLTQTNWVFQDAVSVMRERRSARREQEKLFERLRAEAKAKAESAAQKLVDVEAEPVVAEETVAKPVVKEYVNYVVTVPADQEGLLKEVAYNNNWKIGKVDE